MDERVRQCQALLFLLEEYGDDFWRRIVTVDETWLPHYNPETKAQSKSWVAPGEPPPFKAKSVASAGKTMITVFWDAEGIIIIIDDLEENTTINTDRYIKSLNKLAKKLPVVRPGKVHARILLQQDNARPHTAKKTMAVIREKKWELLPHPPYSPDLAPSDFYLFAPMKDALRGTRYGSKKELMSALEKWVKAQPKEWFETGIKKLVERWQKCIELNGAYVEKSR